MYAFHVPFKHFGKATVVDISNTFEDGINIDKDIVPIDNVWNQ